MLGATMARLEDVIKGVVLVEARKDHLGQASTNVLANRTEALGHLDSSLPVVNLYVTQEVRADAQVRPWEECL